MTATAAKLEETNGGERARAIGTTATAIQQHPSRSQLPMRSHKPGDIDRFLFIVLMGVSGTGKSTLGAALSAVTHLPFFDGDDLHPVANVAKMSRGEPLEDEDRLPWLETIRRTAVAACAVDRVGKKNASAGGEGSGLGLSLDESPGAVLGGGPELRTKNGGGAVDSEAWQWSGVIVACSALKRTYRAVLRGETGADVAANFNPRLRTHFVYLKGEREELMARMLNRKGHFMKAGMLESQLSALESPEGEPGVVTVSVEISTEEQVQKVVDALRLS